MNPLIDFFAGLGAWNWLILAVVLLVLELLIPGVYFLWLAAAAAVVGIVSAFVDLTWQWELVLFAVLSIVTVVATRVLLKQPGMDESDEPNLNRRAHQMIGRVAVLDAPVEGGRGRIKLGDGFWNVTGPDLPKGARVKVVGAKGALLQVEAAK